MSSVDIADIDTALAKVRAFIAIVDQSYTAWEQTSLYDHPSPQEKYTDNQIQEQLPLTTRIAARADPELAAKMRRDASNSSEIWSHTRVPSRTSKAHLKNSRH